MLEALYVNLLFNHNYNIYSKSFKKFHDVILHSVHLV